MSACKQCENPPVSRCKVCGSPLCQDHVVHDDPFHSGGFLYRPADYCKTCYEGKQGKGNAILLLAVIVALGIFVAFMIAGA